MGGYGLGFVHTITRVAVATPGVMLLWKGTEGNHNGRLKL